jgi:fructose-bisphosphate aldolase class 1
MGETQSQTKTCHILKNVLVDAHVEATFNEVWDVDYAFRQLRRGKGTWEEVSKELERAIKNFNEFLRDHRSQDVIGLSVEETRKDICSACRQPYEDAIEEVDGKQIHYCASCGAELEIEKGK